MPSEEKSCLQDRYLLETRLGANGLRETWKSLDQKTQNPVIIKMLFFNGEAAWKEHELFERQAKTLQSLDHPRIPKYQDFFWIETKVERSLNLVQEYIPGQSLAEIDVPLGIEKVLEIAEQVLEILVYLHGLSPPVLHRDIKPSNLILGEDQKIYLIDFGSVQAELNIGHTLTVVGTYGYMAPEQFGGQTLPASDLYGLGATLLYLLTGADPAEFSRKEFQIESNKKIISQQIINRWVNRFLFTNPNQRFTNASDALEEARVISKLFKESEASLKQSNISSIESTENKLLIELSELPKNKVWSLFSSYVFWRTIEGSFFAFLYIINTGNFGNYPLMIFSITLQLPIYLLARIITAIATDSLSAVNGVKFSFSKEKLLINYSVAGIIYRKAVLDLSKPLVIQKYSKAFLFLQENNKSMGILHRLDDAEAKLVAEEIRCWLKKYTRQ